MKAIYTITPSYLIKKKREFREGIKILEKLGFKILNKKPVTKLPSTRRKTSQLHNAFLNKEADMILAHRGGYGSMKLLPRLDFNLIRNHPKVLAGFSDLSALLNVISERTGLTTLHSPMILNFSPPKIFTIRSFLNAVNGFPNRNLLQGAPVNVYRSGKARGRLKGGNLITLTALLGTEWEINTDGAILFFEEVNEKLYEVDRYLTQWILAGKLKKVKGLILGNFRRVKNRDVYDILSSQMKIDFPLVNCPYIGHVKNKLTLPVGARVELNTIKKTLTLL
ncbi:MAG: LD-carboxypeptidase [Deltaproteobacteria bacterium]|nr:LD-carboxypeptidase [Deltaproteobacteria bacterium]MBM4325174.1 LD-carboxypeptidase [Deltaproteobacteria bacterium]